MYIGGLSTAKDEAVTWLSAAIFLETAFELLDEP
jgi:hypothetical protein